MRWADLDSLNHVNNVVYVDYAAESRAILIEDGIVGADERVQRMSVDFLRPLLLSSQSVRVTSTRDGDELVQEITNGVADTVYARVTTAFGAPVDVKRGRATFDPYPLRVRHSDVDATGVASLTKAFEFFQEARIVLFSSIRRDGAACGTCPTSRPRSPKGDRCTRTRIPSWSASTWQPSHLANLRTTRRRSSGSSSPADSLAG